MKALKLCEGVYWVGAIDWNLRNFHGYETEKGSSYNAYLILDEKITLIDTVKEGFEGEMLSRIASVIDPSKIDIIVSNHAEPDHSGSIPAVLKVAKNAKVYTAFGAGVKNLTAYYGDLGYNGVKAGESLVLGKHTLHFVPTPMVHWPDNMVTYMTPGNILFSNDAFGQHYASDERLDTDCDLAEAYIQARKYYANIVQPYGMQTAKALAACADLQTEPRNLLDKTYPRHSRALQILGRQRIRRYGDHRLRHDVAFHGKHGTRHRERFPCLRTQTAPL